VLDYNRIISGKFIFHQETLLLTKLVNDVAQAMQQHADKKHLTLKLEEEISGTGYVLGDPFRLKQILFNLISNAIKFTTVGTITISVKAVEVGDKTNIEFSIIDTGLGIDEKNINLIFNEFEQGPFHNSGESFGSGLGLSIVKSLVDGLGGEIKVKSDINRGSCFSVHLSLTSSDKIDDVIVKSDKKYNIQNGSVDKLWIVDDDTFILELCGTILSNKNIPHKIFSSPQALLNEPFDPRVSHILMDMRLPGLSGKELMNILRKRTESIKIIAFTAQALPEERSKILSEGFDGLLIKPFREAELLEALGMDNINNQSSIPQEIDLGILPF